MEQRGPVRCYLFGVSSHFRPNRLERTDGVGQSAKEFEALGRALGGVLRGSLGLWECAAGSSTSTAPLLLLRKARRRLTKIVEIN